ncbi:unnamed protein product, partial [Durusdinium trenchii]
CRDRCEPAGLLAGGPGRLGPHPAERLSRGAPLCRYHSVDWLSLGGSGLAGTVCALRLRALDACQPGPAGDADADTHC